MTYPLPTGWQQLQIKDVCLIYYGKGLGKNNMVDGNIPVYSSGGIIGYHNESIVNSQGVIIGRKGNAGSVFYSSSPFFCIDTAFYVEANNNIDLKFLYYKLIACKLERYKIDSAVPGINRDTIYSIFLTIPPLEEQKRIAEVLSLCDDVIENLTELIEKKEQYKKGVMQRLLSGEVRFKG
ncbi:restriction endonuclease subunit S, partial [Brachyspira intermedia]|uniref:restriction endonuclease subunit S n=1 Tax=Brachyspira intermedia TaxID=84377 RepID=UPI0030049C27